VVTNNVAEFGDHWRRSIPIAEIFDAVVDSCEVRCRKPAAEIFRVALERLGVLGMHAILVEADPAGAFAELDRLIARSL
jgi:putative hydrolase of the HAD superfamily